MDPPMTAEDFRRAEDELAARLKRGRQTLRKREPTGLWPAMIESCAAM